MIPLLRPVTRRGFLASLAAALPLAFVSRRAHAAAALHLQSDPATLDALAEVVLPSALGRAGLAKETAAFRQWAAGYTERAELNHGYGTSRLRYSGPTPMTQWMRQLDALDSDAHSRFQKPFRALPLDQRESLVRAALQGQQVGRMPAVGDASHVSLALIAHFYDSSAATDLCYEAKIGKATCRPLGDSRRKPLPMLKVSER
jgi:hypothetical protein